MFDASRWVDMLPKTGATAAAFDQLRKADRAVFGYGDPAAFDEMAAAYVSRGLAADDAARIEREAARLAVREAIDELKWSIRVGNGRGGFPAPRDVAESLDRIARLVDEV